MPDALTGRRQRGVFSKRAALRKLAIADHTDPETTGDLERTDRIASLIFVGAPTGKTNEAGKMIYRFGPRGFKTVRESAKTLAGYAKNKLKPIITEAAKRVR